MTKCIYIDKDDLAFMQALSTSHPDEEDFKGLVFEVQTIKHKGPEGEDMILLERGAPTSIVFAESTVKVIELPKEVEPLIDMLKESLDKRNERMSDPSSSSAKIFTIKPPKK